jgi:hypothetical protein
LNESLTVEREEIAVQYVRVDDGIGEIRRAWDELEAAVGSLRGRRFYGAFYPHTDEYRACVELRPGDEPLPSLALGRLPGGRYLRARLRGNPPAVYEQIGPTFEELARLAEPDHRRPSLEFYRRFDEIDLLLPVL